MQKIFTNLFDHSQNQILHKLKITHETSQNHQKSIKDSLKSCALKIISNIYTTNTKDSYF